MGSAPGGCGDAGSAAGAQYPVPYVFSANVAAAALQPGTPPPGSNDWSCHRALDCADHLSIISNPITGQYILNTLDPAHSQPVPRVPVAPAV